MSLPRQISFEVSAQMQRMPPSGVAKPVWRLCKQ